MNIPSLSNLVSPQQALGLVQKVLQDHAKHPVTDFEIQYHHSEKRVDFKVYFLTGGNLPEGYSFNDEKEPSRLYKLDDNTMFKTLLETFMKSLAEKTKNLDYAIVSFRNNGETILCDAYYTNETGEKVKSTIIL